MKHGNTVEHIVTNLSGEFPWIEVNGRTEVNAIANEILAVIMIWANMAGNVGRCNLRAIPRCSRSLAADGTSPGLMG